MEAELLQLIRGKAKGRPYNIIRHVGSRLEVMFYGDHEKTVLQLKQPPDVDLVQVRKMTVAELRQVCLDLEIPHLGLKKAQLVAAIGKALKGTSLDDDNLTG